MQQGTRLKIASFDPSLRNWGAAIASYDLISKKLTIEHISVTCPYLPKGKQYKQNSLDLLSAQQLNIAAFAACNDADVVFVEIPVGSQSSRAAMASGICLGVLGSLRASGIEFFELSPTQVKLASQGSKTATKKEMIQWAVNKHPEAQWPRYRIKGVMTICEGKAEHMADAIATIYAGIQLPAFRDFLTNSSTN